MKRFLILLLIALLPVHGWSAGMMAVAMSASHAVGSAAVDGSGHAAMPADCPMSGKTAGGTGHDDGKGCTACQWCMELAVLVAPAAPSLSLRPHVAAARRNDSFASAMLARVAEPPIL